MRVGFLGIQCDNGNLGVAALAYAAVAIVHKELERDGEFILFSANSDVTIQQMCDQLGIVDRRIRAVPFRHRDPRALLASVREIRSCDVLIDFTGGDSFSDIYGPRRLLQTLIHKQLILATRRPLVLAPQTYGPLKHWWWRPWFGHVVDQATLLFARDGLSVEFLNGLTDREVHLATDVAITLPYDKSRYHFPHSPSTRVGFNISGLLWAGGYSGGNQFNLTTDYRAYCRGVVDCLLTAGHTVHLVSHVLARPWESGEEDDVRAAVELQSEYPSCLLAPVFTSPMEAKSWIHHLDVFIGSRMHATVAALTTGVPTIPAAYSRKFAGFFDNLGYPILVDLTRATTEDAISDTLAHVTDRQRLRRLANKANGSAHRRIEVFLDHLTPLLTAIEHGPGGNERW